jgi:hypothetical protein
MTLLVYLAEIWIQHSLEGIMVVILAAGLVLGDCPRRL